MEAFINSFPGASLTAMRQGFLSIGVEDNSVVLFSDLMDSASLFLTANPLPPFFDKSWQPGEVLRLRRQGARRGMRVRRPWHDGGRPPEELKRMNQ
jgi:hypothetical protein